MTKARLTLVAAATALAALLALVGQTSANGVESGKTKLKPDQDTFEAFADMGIAVEATGRAEFKLSGAKFPVTGGDIDPQAGFKGVVGHAGGLMFSRADGAEIKFKNLSMIIGNSKAKVSSQTDTGDFLRLMTLKDGQLAGTESSFQLKNAEATLSGPAAEALTETFDFPFRRGIPLGTTTTKATITEEQVEE